MNKELILRDKDILLVGVAGSIGKKMIDDFRYIFSTAKVTELVLNSLDELENNQIKEHLAQDGVVLVCASREKKSEVKRKMDSLHLEYAKEFFFADDMFEVLDWNFEEQCKNKILCLYGNDSLRKRLYLFARCFMLKHRIDYRSIEQRKHKNLSFVIFAFLCLVENVVCKTFIFKKNYDPCFEKSLVCVRGADARVNIQYANNFTCKRMYTVNELDMYSNVSKLMEQTYFDEKQNKCGCLKPFNVFYLSQSGQTRLCSCPEFLDIEPGNLDKDTPEEIWNSIIARIVRLSIVNNTYSFCDRNLCKVFNGKPDEKTILQRKTVDLKTYPSDMVIAFDHICNLKCPSCRKDYCTKNTTEIETSIMNYTDKLIEVEWVQKCDRLVVGGDGETFLSNGYKRLLFENEGGRKKVYIMTNGTLFTPSIWEKIEGKYEEVEISVSIDATKEETYKMLRGGSFKQLMKNMDFLSELRKNGNIRWVNVNMIVQQANYKEMKDFVIWAKKKAFDRVYLSHIWNWGTYSDEEFENISMFDKNGNMKEELKCVLEDEIFNDPIVNMRWE